MAVVLQRGHCSLTPVLLYHTPLFPEKNAQSLGLLLPAYGQPYTGPAPLPPPLWRRADGVRGITWYSIIGPVIGRGPRGAWRRALDGGRRRIQRHRGKERSPMPSFWPCGVLGAWVDGVEGLLSSGEHGAPHWNGTRGRCRRERPGSRLGKGRKSAGQPARTCRRTCESDRQERAHPHLHIKYVVVW